MSQSYSIYSQEKILSVVDGNILSYCKGSLHYYDCQRGQSYCVGTFPLDRFYKLLSKYRITSRLLRIEPRFAKHIKEKQYYVSFLGSLYLLDCTERTLRVEISYRQGMNNPLSLVNICNMDGFDDGFYFGEYFSNNNHEEVSIFSNRNGVWKKAYTFPARSIYHIHALVPDYSRNCVYIFTGDENEESGIWQATENFMKVEPLIFGEQRFRSCCGTPWMNGVVFATDTAREQNAIYFMNVYDKLVTKLFDLPGPVIYGVDKDDKFMFSTSVEGDESVGRFRYRFTRKLGRGVKDRESHIIVFDKMTGVIREIAAFKKDLYPMLIFQFGNVQFPEVKDKDLWLACPVSLTKIDGKTIKLNFDKNE